MICFLARLRSGIWWQCILVSGWIWHRRILVLRVLIVDDVCILHDPCSGVCNIYIQLCRTVPASSALIWSSPLFFFSLKTPLNGKLSKGFTFKETLCYLKYLIFQLPAVFLQPKVMWLSNFLLFFYSQKLYDFSTSCCLSTAKIYLIIQLPAVFL